MLPNNKIMNVHTVVRTGRLIKVFTNIIKLSKSLGDRRVNPLRWRSLSVGSGGVPVGRGVALLALALPLAIVWVDLRSNSIIRSISCTDPSRVGTAHQLGFRHCISNK
jgi:hypothetical protein